MPLGPLGVVALPVPVGSEVDPHLPPHEAHDAPVRHPRHPGLEVVHDAQSLDQSEMSIAELSTNPSPPWLPACSRCWRSKSPWPGTGPSPASRASRHPPSPRAGCTRAKRNWNIFYDVKYFSSHIWNIDIVDHDSWCSPVVIFLLLKEGEVHDGEGDKLVVEHNVLEMLLVEEPVADPDLAEGLGARYLGPNASAASPLLRQPHPVVPVTADQSEMSIKNTAVVTRASLHQSQLTCEPTSPSAPSTPPWSASSPGRGRSQFWIRQNLQSVSNPCM